MVCLLSLKIPGKGKEEPPEGLLLRGQSLGARRGAQGRQYEGTLSYSEISGQPQERESWLFAQKGHSTPDPVQAIPETELPHMEPRDESLTPPPPTREVSSDGRPGERSLSSLCLKQGGKGPGKGCGQWREGGVVQRDGGSGEGKQGVCTLQGETGAGEGGEVRKSSSLLGTTSWRGVGAPWGPRRRQGQLAKQQGESGMCRFGAWRICAPPPSLSAASAASLAALCRIPSCAAASLGNRFGNHSPAVPPRHPLPQAAPT